MKRKRYKRFRAHLEVGTLKGRSRWSTKLSISSVKLKISSWIRKANYKKAIAVKVACQFSKLTRKIIHFASNPSWINLILDLWSFRRANRPPIKSSVFLDHKIKVHVSIVRWTPKSILKRVKALNNLTKKIAIWARMKNLLFSLIRHSHGYPRKSQENLKI